MRKNFFILPIVVALSLCAIFLFSESGFASDELDCASVPKTRMEFLRKLADAGHLGAQKEIAFTLENSEHWNPREALFWLMVIAARETPPLPHIENRIKELKTHLSAEETQEAISSAESWHHFNKNAPLGDVAPRVNFKGIACGFYPEKITDICGDLIGFDGGHALDSPYFFINKNTGDLRGTCSFFDGKCVVPLEWDCDCPKLASGANLSCTKSLADEERKHLIEQRKSSNVFSP